MNLNWAIYAVAGFALAYSTQLAVAAAPQCDHDDILRWSTNSQGASSLVLLQLKSGNYFGGLGQWSDEIDAAQRAKESPNASPNAMFVASLDLAIGYRHEGLEDQAISQINSAIDSHVDDAYAYHVRGIIFNEMGQADQAISDETKSIMLDPCDQGSYKTRAQAYRRKNDITDAVADEAVVLQIDSKYIARHPQNKYYYELRGIDEMDQKKYDSAIADYTQAIALAPKDPDGFLDRSSLYGDEGNYVQAISDAMQAVTLAPNNANAWNNLCWNMAKSGDPSDAAQSCNHAVALAPREAAFLDSKAFVELQLKDYNDAIADYVSATKINPDFASPWYGIGLAERARGDIPDSDAFMAKALKMDPGVADEFSNKIP